MGVSPSAGLPRHSENSRPTVAPEIERCPDACSAAAASGKLRAPRHPPAVSAATKVARSPRCGASAAPQLTENRTCPIGTGGLFLSAGLFLEPAAGRYSGAWAYSKSVSAAPRSMLAVPSTRPALAPPRAGSATVIPRGRVGRGGGGRQ
eukprot:scaffold33507_cov67-Isochrysis_galbana.AAC.1